MAEIKEPRSAFAAHEKSNVQEWLDDPCTKELAHLLDIAVRNSEDSLVDFAKNIPRSATSDDIASDARKIGAVIATFEAVGDLLTEAQRYANS